MRNKPKLMVALLVILVSSFLSLQVGAYGLFQATPPESGQCSQCHSDWPGATHTIHTGFGCASCHVEELPVAVSSCATCHPAANLLTAHSPLEGPGDLAYCGYCHAGTGTEHFNMGEIKALFK
nr:hypothetical protein [Candidatus Krumholzibacteria bacterium]